MPNFSYTARDYATIRSELLTRAERSIPEWTDRDASDFMVALVDLWAYAADVLHFYIDRAATESFLGTATQRESVLALANLYGYTPNKISSATTTVTVRNDTTETVTVPAGTELTGNPGTGAVYYYSTTPVTMASGATGNIALREGTKYTLQSVTNAAGTQLSDGLAGQRFALFHKNVDPDTIKVYVNEGVSQSNILWRKVQNLTTVSASDSVYTFYTSADGTCYVIFGNGVNGRIPPNGTSITASYTASTGTAGAISANVLTSFTGNSLPGVTIVSSQASQGGSDGESIDSMKAAIPRTIRTNGTAVTLSDFADLALGVEGVTKTAAQYSPGSGTGGSVTIYAVTTQSDWTTAASTPVDVPVSTREAIYNAVSPKTVLGIGSIAIPSTVSVTQVYITVDLYVKDNYVAVYVSEAVSSAIDSLLSFSKIDFGQVLTIGEFYRAILSIEGVDYAVITDFNTTSASGGIAASGKITINDYQLPRKGGVEITTFGGVTPPA